MSTENWQVVEEVSGELQAEILRGLLEAQGIQVLLSQEGAAHYAFSLSVGPMSIVQVLVPTSQVEAAQEILKDYHQGKFEAEPVDLPDDTPPDEDREETSQ